MWHHFLQLAIGRGVAASALSAEQVALRSVVGYAAALIMVRITRRRFMGRNSAMDIIVAVTFGSTLSRGLTGNAPLGPVLVGCGVLVGLDWLLAAIGVRSDWFDRLVKGTDVVLVEQGEPRTRSMNGQVISRRDLMESVRLQGKTDHLQEVGRATLERNGNISIISQPKQPKPYVVEVRVEANVQVVRLEIVA
jgi:uncharacterized membrane protein YcaP (DUF421 family)